ncbi:DUF11 domain-containing protein, partial [Lewinella sp. W8]|nr:DUF11 domain-containing protein [Lewinella sp. W8]
MYVIASLLQGESISFEVTYAIDATFQGSSVRNEAEITEDDGDDEDSTPDNDDDTEDDQDDVETPIEQTYDLAIDKRLAIGQAPGTVTGGFVRYLITVTNEGSLNASNIGLMDLAPAGLQYVSADVSGTNVIENGGGEFTVPSLLQGASVTFEITYQVGLDVPVLSTLTNQVEIDEDDGDDVDSNPEESFDEDDFNDGIEDDDEDEVEIPVLGINVEKTVSDDSVCPGDEVTYTLTVRFRDNVCSPGFEIRDINVEDMSSTGFQDMFMPGDDNFVTTSDPNGDGILQCGEEFMWTYTRILNETDTNIATDMGDIYFVFPDGSESFVGSAMFSDTVTVIVNDPAEVTVTDVDPNGSIQCKGETGSLTVNIITGTGPYSFQWDAATGNQTTQTATNLVAGTYFVTITDGNGCITIDQGTLVEPDELSVSGVTTDVICNDDAGTSDDGTITLTVVGGTAGYTYAWSNGATTQNLSGLAAGTYTVVVTDANGCTTTE